MWWFELRTIGPAKQKLIELVDSGGNQPTSSFKIEETNQFL